MILVPVTFKIIWKLLDWKGTETGIMFQFLNSFRNGSTQLEVPVIFSSQSHYILCSYAYKMVG